MAELIDRDALKRHYAWWGDTDERKMFDAIVDEQPTVDAVPVVHGRWIGENVYRKKCSVCGSCGSIMDEPIHQFKYCPNCGAMMEGKEQI